MRTASIITIVLSSLLLICSLGFIVSIVAVSDLREAWIGSSFLFIVAVGAAGILACGLVSLVLAVRARRERDAHSARGSSPTA
ncbi:MAG: hypothetical protein J0J05_02520 [Microbacterium sp.]|uniref:hypothetical protein n=1 Tax=Microbacterium sp. TaxID=51671 RepID=UPI001AC6368A|nr:hypothetical protein [Microbacterium sp.]MBN9152844.1 hypothetical protein [Microbacterium sp.]